MCICKFHTQVPTAHLNSNFGISGLGPNIRDISSGVNVKLVKGGFFNGATLYLSKSILKGPGTCRGLGGASGSADGSFSVVPSSWGDSVVVEGTVMDLSPVGG